MDRYSLLFDRLSARNEGAFVPFVTIGDPNPTLSLQIIDTLVESGADALELGIPFFRSACRRSYDSRRYNSSTCSGDNTTCLF